MGNFGANLLGGVAGSFGNSLGSAAGGLIANKGAQVLGLAPKPPQPKSVSQQISDTNQYLEGVFPGTNPWERLGVNAGNPLEVAQEQQRSGQQQHAAALRAQMAMQATQFGMQRQLQETQLSTQETLKRMEIAASKSIAETQARANVLNGVGTADPEALAGVGEFLRTGQVNPSLMKIRGTSAMRHREVVVREQELFNNIERVMLQARDVSLRERQTVLDEQIKPIMAQAQSLSASRAGGFWGPFNQIIEHMKDTAKKMGNPTGMQEWIENYRRQYGPKGQ